MDDTSRAPPDAAHHDRSFGLFLDKLHGNNSVSDVRPTGVARTPTLPKNAAVMVTPERNETTSAYDGALSFEAPFLVDKLVKTGTCSTAAEAEEHFTELKKYLIIVSSNRGKVWSIYSVRIDSVWHEFILFTEAYAAYCQTHFGFYIHHSPSNAPKADGLAPKPAESWDSFRAVYYQLFGAAPPSAWDDTQNLTPAHRVINESADELTVRHVGSEVELVGAHERAILAVNDLAYEAMEFICRTRAFYVRELPGDLAANEKTALVAVLMKSSLLRLAS
jgi:hypothetical protein